MKTERFGLLPSWFARKLGIINTYYVEQHNTYTKYMPVFGSEFWLWSKPIDENNHRYFNGKCFVTTNDLLVGKQLVSYYLN